MTVNQDNPAGRLWVVLHGLRSCAGRKSVRDAWHEVLETGEDPIRLQVGLAAVSALSVQLLNELRALEGQISNRYLSYYPNWTCFIGTQSTVAHDHFEANQVVTEQQLDMLEALADNLHGRDPEETIVNERVTELLESVEQLIGEVLEAEDLDPDFRAFLLGHLNEVEQALRNIKLYGPARIDEVIGRVVRDADKRPSRWIAFTDNPLLNSFRRLMNLLPTAAQRSGQILQLAENANKFLEITGGTVPPH